MIQHITATNWRGDSVRMELSRPETSGFVIFNVTGIGPPKANINIKEFANIDGGKFNSSKALPRNIVLTLKYLGAPLIEDVRHESYRFFPLQKPVKITIQTDRRTVETIGYVESNEAHVFSSQSYSQISILCPDAFFKSMRKTVTVFSGETPMFEFPFSNESLTENLLIMSEKVQTTVQNIVYNGDVETGIVITIHARGSIVNPAVHNLDTNESIFINTTMIDGDDVIISTVSGDKYVRRLRSGVYTNILNEAIVDGRLPNWFRLSKGNNTFAYTADSGQDDMEFSIVNDVLFEGV